MTVVSPVPNFVSLVTVQIAVKYAVLVMVWIQVQMAVKHAIHIACPARLVWILTYAFSVRWAVI